MLTLDIQVCTLLDEKIYESFTFFNTGGDHEGRPATGILERGVYS